MSGVVGTAHDDLARLLGEQTASGATGLLTATRGKHKRLFCLEDGWVVFARSNIIEEQFGRTLVREGVLTAGALESASQHAKEEKKSLSAYLLEQELPPPDALRRLMETHILGQLRSSLEWTNGEYSFKRGRPDLGDELTVRVSCAGPILEHVAKYRATISDVLMRIGPPDVRPILVADRRELVASVEPSETLTYLLEHCDGSRDLAALTGPSPSDEEQTLRALSGLMLIGVLSAARPEVQQQTAVEAVSRKECEARLDRALEADHYGVLGVTAQASTEDIREAYYYLARRYHPDRFRSGSLQDLLERIEGYFAKVTEAYNTLYDEDARAEYDRQLEQKIDKEAGPERDASYLARQNFARAKILIDRKKYQDAVQFLENAIQLDDSQASFHIELGSVLTRNPRRRLEAVEHLKKATEIDPTSVPAYFNLGLLYRKLNRDDDASQMFREVLRWEPHHVEAIEQLKELGFDEAAEGGMFGGLFKS